MDVDVGVCIESCKNMDQQEDCEDKDNDEDAMEDESDEMSEESDEDDDDSEGEVSSTSIRTPPSLSSFFSYANKSIAL
jgi:hypothetical protein